MFRFFNCCRHYRPFGIPFTPTNRHLDEFENAERDDDYKYKGCLEAIGKCKSLEVINLLGTQLTLPVAKKLNPDWYWRTDHPMNNLWELKLKRDLPEVSVVYNRLCGSLMNGGINGIEFKEPNCQ